MKRKGNLYEILISDENLYRAIEDVNRGHRWRSHHRPNRTVAYIDGHKDEAVAKLREIIESGFIQGAPRTVRRYDQSSQKWRNISVPKLWPDQYIHHALVQTLEPVMMRGMDRYCCGSIKGRGTHYGVKAINKWMRNDKRGTKYCLELDIRHFYENLSPDVVIDRMKELVKDRRVLALCESILRYGVPIGFYTSQWFANTSLQPLDQLIRQSGLCKHYVRYMDNFTIFGRNKKHLHRLRREIEAWLNARGMEVKANWQVFPTKTRYPSAMGYRFCGENVLPRKRNRLRLTRQIRRCRKKIAHHRKIGRNLAAGLLSRLGQMRHCRHVQFYKKYLPPGMQKTLKGVMCEYDANYRSALPDRHGGAGRDPGRGNKETAGRGVRQGYGRTGG